MLTTHIKEIRIMRVSLLSLFSVAILILSGCSSGYLNSRPSTRVAIPKIPEIKQPVAVKRKRAPVRKVIKSTPKPVVKRVVRKPQKNYSISSSVQPNIAKPPLVEAVEAVKKAPVALDVDPYEDIPEASSPSGRKPTTRIGSPAIYSLMMRARADLAVGNTESAVIKLERGLRIESQNPSIWHLLAQAHFAQNNHPQAITMAKKSIRYTDDNGLISKNWALIKKAGEKADDPIAIKKR